MIAPLEYNSGTATAMLCSMKRYITYQGQRYLVITHPNGSKDVFVRVNRKWSGGAVTSAARLALSEGKT